MYTLYFSLPVEMDKEKFAKFAVDAKAILENSEVQIADESGQVLNGFVVTDDLINFNGYGSNSHEPCIIKRVDTESKYIKNGFVSNFCKTTEAKPYRNIVIRILNKLKEHFPEIQIFELH